MRQARHSQASETAGQGTVPLVDCHAGNDEAVLARGSDTLRQRLLPEELIGVRRGAVRQIPQGLRVNDWSEVLPVLSSPNDLVAPRLGVARNGYNIVAPTRVRIARPICRIPGSQGRARIGIEEVL
ncbi:MAG: hypothetical protein HYU30_06995 [Chloroflexi bacterium]|nr:hypothetical protein [Chloroflexota bacterium]